MHAICVFFISLHSLISSVHLIQVGVCFKIRIYHFLFLPIWVATFPCTSGRSKPWHCHSYAMAQTCEFGQIGRIWPVWVALSSRFLPTFNLKSGHFLQNVYKRLFSYVQQTLDVSRIVNRPSGINFAVGISGNGHTNKGKLIFQLFP